MWRERVFLMYSLSLQIDFMMKRRRGGMSIYFHNLSLTDYQAKVKLYPELDENHRAQKIQRDERFSKLGIMLDIGSIHGCLRNDTIP